MRIALQQLDNLGDVILTFPMAALIKKHYPGAQVIMIAREISRPIAALCADIDEFYAASTKEEDASKEIENLKNLHLDAIVHVASGKKPILYWAKAAKIPIRVGNWRRVPHIKTCNRLVYIKREHVQLSEAVLNAKLLKGLKIPHEHSFKELNAMIHLNPLPKISEKVANLLDENKLNIVIHPGSSAQQLASKEWPESYFLKLLDFIDHNKVKVFVTGTIGSEYERFKNFVEDPRVTNLVGKLSIPELVQLLQGADNLVCGSTGPLHISGLLNQKCLGLYLPHPSKNANRWGPFGANSEIITAENCKHCNTTKKPREDACQCMLNITPEMVAARII